jgi:UDP:flavonoid glycosyltransferase YjiC (YdhE family)
LGKRILLTTTGSLGDLHPFLAIGLGLQERGHTVTIATSNTYRTKVEQTGLGFAPMGPHLDKESADFARKVMHARNGPEYLMRRVLYPAVPAVYAEVTDAMRGADVVVTHPITYASQIAAEKSGLPWISAVTAPISFFSKYDPPVMAPMPILAKLRPLGSGVNGVLVWLAHAKTKPWMKSITEFRASLGMPPGRDPIFEGQHSPQCVLAMFSRLMGEPQPDWPPHVHVIGFPFYDQAEHGQELDPELQRFLDAGEPPVVFTLGSSAVLDAGRFYEESLLAAKHMGRRAVLLAGANAIAGPLPAGTAVFAYAPFSKILPRAACVVHQGGIGTCGQALAAGRPMLVMPYAFDQPDNAARLERLGVARVIGRNRYTARRAAAELDRLLTDGNYAERAKELACSVAQEDAVRAACDTVEKCAAGGSRIAQQAV